MKKYIIILIAICFYTGASSQGTIYNNGAYIVNDGSGSYWVVDGDFTLTSSDASKPTKIYNLKVNGSSSLTLGSASSPAYLTVNGSLINNGAFTIESGSTGTSSLILGSYSDFSATVKRYFTGANLAWHLLSSPVSGQGISGDFTPSGSTYDFYLYNEPTNEWINRKNTSGGSGTGPFFDDVNGDLNFTPGRGYMVAYDESNPTKSFVGRPNQGTISQSLTIDGSTSYQGANLVGNPYPCSIDWKTPDGWTRSMLRDDDPGAGTAYTMYIWNETANNYGTFISNGADGSGTNSVTRYIPPMQGFFVMAASAGTFKMYANIRVHESTSSWLKNSNINANIIKLKVSTPAHGSDEVVIEDSKTNASGAPKLFSFVETAPSLWLDFENEQYSVLLHNIGEEDNSYPIGFKSGVEEQCTITATFDMSVYSNLILEDKKLNKFHNLLESQNYSFYSSPEDNPNRFILHFSPVGIDEQQNQQEAIQVWASNHTLNICNTNNHTGEIKVVNMFGQTVINTKLKGSSNQQLSVNVPTGYYIVHIITNKGVINKKLYFN